MFPEPLTVPTMPTVALAYWTWVLGCTEHTVCGGPAGCAPVPGNPRWPESTEEHCVPRAQALR